MPVRPFSRDQAWLLPPTLDEAIDDDHPVRFVGAFVDAIDRAAWDDLGIAPAGASEGAPAYHPRLLLSVWLYGFMTGVRSSRKLEAACCDQLPYLWLTGFQQPDHNTLWRFYQAHRTEMRVLLTRSIRTAVAAGLVDLAVQAVDGSKVAGNASRPRTLDEAALRRLLERTEAALADLEAQNSTDGPPAPARLPEQLRHAQALRARVHEALARVAADEGPRRVNLTDGDAMLQRTRSGYLVGYNAQAVASPLTPIAGRGGQLITAAAVVQDNNDSGQLLPMIEEAAANCGEEAAATVADAGYHSARNLAACEERRHTVAMPEAQGRKLQAPYHKDAFLYDPDTDSYRCPEGQPLRSRAMARDPAGQPTRRYGAEGDVCRACPAFGLCTRNARHGRRIEIRKEDESLRRHRAWMATDAAQTLYRRRQGLIEPAFGIMKEQQGARRFLLRGLTNVRAEWTLLATAFNLRVLARIWQQMTPRRSVCALG